MKKHHRSAQSNIQRHAAPGPGRNNFDAIEDPLPHDFEISLHLWYGVPKNFDPQRPFTPSWERGWEEIAGRQTTDTYSFVSKEVQDLFLGASNRLRIFKKRDGLRYLEALARRRANPDFILSLLVRYLWNDRIPVSENASYEITSLNDYLHAIIKTKEYYRVYFRALDSVASEDKPTLQWLVNTYGGEPCREFEPVLDQMETKITRLLNAKDLRTRSKRRPPNEKANRIIFSIYEHLNLRTGGPNWELFWSLLVASDAISGGGASSGNKDRRIRPHIDSFLKDHPKEAAYIHECMVKNLPPFSYW